MDPREPEQEMPGAQIGNALVGCFFGCCALAILVGCFFLIRMAAKILPHEEPDFSAPPAASAGPD